jgi:hypothetical protein
MFKQIIRTSIVTLALLLLATQTTACGKMEMATDQQSFKASEVKTVTIDPGVVTPKPTVKTSYQPILADRYYLVSLFKEVFGPNATIADSTNTSVRFQDHGSPCSIYTYHSKMNAAGTGKVENSPMDRCAATSADLTAAPMNPQATVTRQVLIAHACSDLVANAATFKYALSKIQPTGIPAATEANVLKAYRLFYRVGAEPHKGLTESLLVMLPQKGVTADHWRVVFNTICSSGFWQAI